MTVEGLKRLKVWVRANDFTVEAKFISVTLYEQFEKEGEEIDKMLNGYIAYLKKSKQGANEPGANSIISEDRTP